MSGRHIVEHGRRIQPRPVGLPRPRPGELEYADGGPNCVYSGVSMSLRSKLNELAAQFADAIVNAIRGSSLEELLAQTGGDGPRRGPGRPRGPAATTEPKARGRRPGRLPRRSAEEIAAELDRVVGLVKKSKAGLRAEEIRATLKMQSRR